ICSESKLNASVCNIFYAHKISCFADPCCSTLVKNVKEGILRSVGKKHITIEPIRNKRQCSYIWFKEDCIEVLLRQSKTDQYKKGDVVVIAKSNNDVCPVKILRMYMDLAELSENSNDFCLE
ncbi:hypothetical protein MAR_030528, partial [Mya arenaria]